MRLDEDRCYVRRLVNGVGDEMPTDLIGRGHPGTQPSESFMHRRMDDKPWSRRVIVFAGAFGRWFGESSPVPAKNYCERVASAVTVR